MFKRPEITHNERVRRRRGALRRGRAVRAAPGVVLGQGRAAGPAAGHGRSPPGLHRQPVRHRRRCDLTYAGVSTPFGGEPEESHERPGEEFAKGHYEQLVRATGTITVGEDTWTVDGFGLRDHSWGPRSWQAPWYYRWLTVNFGDGIGHDAQPDRPPGRPRHPGRLRVGRVRPPPGPRRPALHRAGRARTPTTARIRATFTTARDDEDLDGDGVVTRSSPARS